MIHVSETMAIHTVEAFLSDDDVRQLTEIMDTACAETPEHQAFLEMNAPADAQEILAAASRRALPAIRSVFPSIHGFAPWRYAEFKPGQFVVSHVDGIEPTPGGAPRRIGRMGVVIQDAAAGGQFYVDTTSSDQLWEQRPDADFDGYAPGMRFARIAGHEMIDQGDAAWVAELPRTRWTTSPRVGVGVVYGAQIVHGTEPVLEGTVRKFVTSLTDI